MDITLDELRILSGQKGFNIVMIEKDYLITKLLYLLKDIKGICFKGGTALNKLFLNNSRISEDLDFSLDRDIKEVEKDIHNALNGTIFTTMSKGKEREGFTRLILNYRLFHEEGKIFIDLNQKATILLKPEIRKVEHFYKNYIPEFSISCLNLKELIAEKIRATATRYKPRDYIDLYHITQSKLPISISLIKKKFKSINKTFSINLIFKNTNKVFNIWEKDLAILMPQRKEFKEVISTIAKFFHYKEAKDSTKPATSASSSPKSPPFSPNPPNPLRPKQNPQKIQNPPNKQSKVAKQYLAVFKKVAKENKRN